jgi:peptidoglycan hydrolase-like protein with peptidoglycan-binding domain
VTSVPADQSLKPGMSGSSVTALQQALTQLGYNPGTADGSYGPSTTQAVTAFQTAKGLTADGVAGPATLAAINTALSAG